MAEILMAYIFHLCMAASVSEKSVTKAHASMHATKLLQGVCIPMLLQACTPMLLKRVYIHQCFCKHACTHASESMHAHAPSCDDSIHCLKYDHDDGLHPMPLA